ncbi:uncharacterized protein si:dkeyp-41f9.4 [Onychostoma macrolepis]|uniref:Uncharacterized protein n=1 Tax=Onychostoma macrolepis TaxID=369639 RepID=A0A7J6CLE4_9TELE|nr:uncharacterized protein si:dkeyp-41f9.4 [Onychostoma macrolepis]KAF4107996.1 hypothetical protein G5714_010755 [Onychostoma macrolepis]
MTVMSSSQRSQVRRLSQRSVLRNQPHISTISDTDPERLTLEIRAQREQDRSGGSGAESPHCFPQINDCVHNLKIITQSIHMRTRFKTPTQPRGFYMPEIKMGPEESARFLSSISTSRTVPAGAVLGPCAATHTSLCDSVAFIACKCADRRKTAYLLQMDPSVSSKCLQMIQSARNAEEQNLEAYMKNGHLFFRAIKDIPENTELLVWYGRDLAKLLGLSTEQKNTKGLMCSECKQSFLFQFPLLAHKRFFCIKKPTSFLKKITIPEIRSSKPATNFHNLARDLENCRKNRPTDAKSPKRRCSLESDTDESDGEPSSFDTRGDEKVLVKRFCVNGANRCSWSSSSEKSFSEGQNSPCSQPQCHDSCTTDPDNQDLKSSTIVTKSAFTTRVSNDVQGDKNKKSAFTQPPPHIPLMSTSLTNNRTSILPSILPLSFHSSALLNTDLPKIWLFFPVQTFGPRSPICCIHTLIVCSRY